MSVYSVVWPRRIARRIEITSEQGRFQFHLKLSNLSGVKPVERLQETLGCRWLRQCLPLQYLALEFVLRRDAIDGRRINPDFLKRLNDGGVRDVKNGESF